MFCSAQKAKVNNVINSEMGILGCSHFSVYVSLRTFHGDRMAVSGIPGIKSFYEHWSSP